MVDLAPTVENDLGNEKCVRNDLENENELNTKVKFEPPLYIQRYNYLCDILLRFNCKTYLDIGCAECKLLRLLKNSNQMLNLIAGIDIDESLLLDSKEKFLNNLFDYVQPRERPLDLYLIKDDISNPSEYLIDRLSHENSGLDCVSLIEVIEHMYPETLDKCIKTVFARLKPRLVLITTPNSEFNVIFDELEGNQSSGDQVKKFRHWDHKFEWTRAEFEDWCENEILKKYPSYKLNENSFDGVGFPPQKYENVGFCSQIALFINQDYKDETDSNQFQKYLAEKIQIGLFNRQLRPNQSKKKQELFLKIDQSVSEPGESRLIFSMSYPFEIYEFSNLEDRNKALVDELNYIINFLTQPSKSFKFGSANNNHDSDSHLSEEDQVKLENNIDLYDESIRIAKVDKICEFSSIVKFKLTKNELVEIMKNNGFKFTSGDDYVIFELFEESDDYEDEDQYDNSIENKRDHSIEDIWEEDHLCASFTEISVKDDGNKSECSIEMDIKVPAYSVSAFDEEMWDQDIKAPLCVLEKSKIQFSLEEQFEDVQPDSVLASQTLSIEKVLNFKFTSRSDRLRLSDFMGYNYNSTRQKELTYKLRSTFKRSIKELKNQNVINETNWDFHNN